MSDTSTSTSTDVTAYRELLCAISGMAADCASKLSRTSIPKYRERRSRITLQINTTIIDSDGRVEPWQSDPIPVTGWELEERPFFLSDPAFNVPGALFIRRFDGTCDPVEESLYEECLFAWPIDLVMPVSKLNKAREELQRIKNFRT